MTADFSTLEDRIKEELPDDQDVKLTQLRNEPAITTPDVYIKKEVEDDVSQQTNVLAKEPVTTKPDVYIKKEIENAVSLQKQELKDHAMYGIRKQAPVISNSFHDLAGNKTTVGVIPASMVHQQCRRRQRRIMFHHLQDDSIENPVKRPKRSSYVPNYTRHVNYSTSDDRKDIKRITTGPADNFSGLSSSWGDSSNRCWPNTFGSVKRKKPNWSPELYSLSSFLGKKFKQEDYELPSYCLGLSATEDIPNKYTKLCTTVLKAEEVDQHVTMVTPDIHSSRTEDICPTNVDIEQDKCNMDDHSDTLSEQPSNKLNTDVSAERRLDIKSELHHANERKPLEGNISERMGECDCSLDHEETKTFDVFPTTLSPSEMVTKNEAILSSVEMVEFKKMSMVTFVEEVARKQPENLFIAFSQDYNEDLVYAVSANCSNVLMCVKINNSEAIAAVPKLIAVHTHIVHLESTAMSLHFFAFGSTTLPEKIFTGSRCRTLERLEETLKEYAESKGLKLVYVIRHSDDIENWTNAARKQLREKVIVTNY